MTAGIAADKPFQKVFRFDIQRIAGDVLERYDRAVAGFCQRDVDARAGEGIFDDIRAEVVEHAPQETAVRRDEDFLVRKAADRGEFCAEQTFFVFADRLPEHLVQFDPLKIHRDRAGRRLRRFHKVFRQLFQSERMTVDRVRVLTGFSVRMFRQQKVGVIDDRGQRGLDVVGNVRNQLGFEAFAFHLRLYRRLQTVAEGVQPFRLFPEDEEQVRRIGLFMDVAVCHVTDALRDRVGRPRTVDEQGTGSPCQRKPDQQCGSDFPRIDAEREHEEAENAVQDNRKHRPPHQRETAAEARVQSGAFPGNPVNNCVRPQRTELNPDGNEVGKSVEKRTPAEEQGRNHNEIGNTIDKPVREAPGKQTEQKCRKKHDFQRDSVVPHRNKLPGFVPLARMIQVTEQEFQQFSEPVRQRIRPQRTAFVPDGHRIGEQPEKGNDGGEEDGYGGDRPVKENRPEECAA